MGKKDKKDKTAPVVVKRKAKPAEVEAPQSVEEVETVETVEAVEAVEAPQSVEVHVSSPAPAMQPPAEGDPMYGFFNRLLDIARTETAIPVVFEKCPCGGEVALSEVMPEADRKRVHNAWLRRHKEHTAFTMGAAESDED